MGKLPFGVEKMVIGVIFCVEIFTQIAKIQCSSWLFYGTPSVFSFPRLEKNVTMLRFAGSKVWSVFM